MDVTTKAIVLKATDYKENDKLVWLYSLEYGKICVHAKGVRKSNAKLKYACDQFCFGQYELAQNGDRLTLKTCQQLESFYSLREDIIVYYASCVLAESLLNYTEEGQNDTQIFLATLKALEQLTDGVEPLTVTLKYILDFWTFQGFKLDFSHCSVCQATNVKLFLDLQRGGVVCDKCRSVDSIAVSPQVVATCRMLDGIPYEKLKNLNFTLENLKDALGVCYKYVSHGFTPLKTLSELLKLA